MVFEPMKCPRCGSDCDRIEVDIGVGIQCGPWHCTQCEWSQEDDLPLILEEARSQP